MTLKPYNLHISILTFEIIEPKQLINKIVLYKSFIYFLCHLHSTTIILANSFKILIV